MASIRVMAVQPPAHAHAITLQLMPLSSKSARRGDLIPVLPPATVSCGYVCRVCSVFCCSIALSLAIALCLSQVPSSPHIFLWLLPSPLLALSSLLFSSALFSAQIAAAVAAVPIFTVTGALVAEALIPQFGQHNNVIYAIAGAVGLFVCVALHALMRSFGYCRTNCRRRGRRGHVSKGRDAATRANGTRSNNISRSNSRLENKYRSSPGVENKGAHNVDLIMKAGASPVKSELPDVAPKSTPAAPSSPLPSPSYISSPSHKTFVGLDLPNMTATEAAKYTVTFTPLYALGIAALFAHFALGFWFVTVYNSLDNMMLRAILTFAYSPLQGIIARCSSILMPRFVAAQWSFASIVFSTAVFRPIFVSMEGHVELLLVLTVEFIRKFCLYVILQHPKTGEWLLLEKWSRVGAILERVLPLAIMEPEPPSTEMGLAQSAFADRLAHLRVTRMRIGTGNTPAGAALSGRMLLDHVMAFYFSVALIAISALVRTQGPSNSYSYFQVMTAVDAQKSFICMAASAAFQPVCCILLHVLRAWLLGSNTRRTVVLGLPTLVQHPFFNLAAIACASLCIVLGYRTA